MNESLAIESYQPKGERPVVREKSKQNGLVFKLQNKNFNSTIILL